MTRQGPEVEIMIKERENLQEKRVNARPKRDSKGEEAQPNNGQKTKGRQRMYRQKAKHEMIELKSIRRGIWYTGGGWMRLGSRSCKK